MPGIDLNNSLLINWRQKGICKLILHWSPCRCLCYDHLTYISSYLLGRPSRDLQWIFWFGIGCKWSKNSLTWYYDKKRGKKGYTDILTCIFRASQENSISRPNASYFSDHFDRSGLSSKTCSIYTKLCSNRLLH